MEYAHRPVLLQEVLKHLVRNKDGVYIDGTFGRGGHTKGILAALSAKGLVIGIDRDPAAKIAAQELCKDARFKFVQSSFSAIDSLAKDFDVAGKVSGVLFDLGVSSPQLDTAERGFSFLKEGPLDMRMDPTQGMDACTWINQAREEEIMWVLKHYGEERFAGRIAKAIVDVRRTARIETTKQLAEIVSRANPKWEKYKHPATRTFQAIRIFINDELETLKVTLVKAVKVLKVGGRLAVISFHSLEDRIVKRFIREEEQGPKLPKALPIREAAIAGNLKRINQAIKPDEMEINKNPRARSAILRIAEKIK